MNNDSQTLQLDAPGERLDKVLVNRLPDLSRTQIQRLLKEGQILVNGRSAKANLRLVGGEEVVISLPEAEESEIIPEPIPLDIRYEDENMLIINKPAGMVVHPAPGHSSGTLVNAVLYHCPNLPGIGGEKRPGIVHRLDKNTSGLITVAKNELALRHLQAQFKERSVGKAYLALVDGQVQPATALIDAPIGRDPRQRKKMAVIPIGGSARTRPAQTQYETITSYDDHTLLRCELFTGRTHQIRVHLAYIGFPIVGDKVYGRRKQSFQIGRHFLHAAELRLKRPSDNETITFTAELPSELEYILHQLAQ